MVSSPGPRIALSRRREQEYGGHRTLVLCRNGLIYLSGSKMRPMSTMAAHEFPYPDFAAGHIDQNGGVAMNHYDGHNVHSTVDTNQHHALCHTLTLHAIQCSPDHRTQMPYQRMPRMQLKASSPTRMRGPAAQASSGYHRTACPSRPTPGLPFAFDYPYPVSPKT